MVVVVVVVVVVVMVMVMVMLMIRRTIHYSETYTGNFGILSLAVFFTDIHTVDPLFALK